MFRHVVQERSGVNSLSAIQRYTLQDCSGQRTRMQSSYRKKCLLAGGVVDCKADLGGGSHVVSVQGHGRGQCQVRPDLEFVQTLHVAIVRELDLGQVACMHRAMSGPAGLVRGTERAAAVVGLNT